MLKNKALRNGKIAGKKEGERLQKIKIAKSLIQMGLSIEQISQATKLTAKEIQKIKESLK